MDAQVNGMFMNKIMLWVSLMLLSACGFHLKGSGTVRSELPYRQWAVQNGQQMQLPLETALRQQPQTQMADSQRAEAVLAVRQVNTQKDILWTNLGGSVIEYLLVLRVEAQVWHRGQAVGEPMTVLVRRPMRYSDSQILGKAEEEAQLWADMRQDAAAQMMRRIAISQPGRRP